MDISFNNIKLALQSEDIEGLIASGAPNDEYDSEAKIIAAALEALPADQQTQKAIVATLALVWAKSFNRSAQEIAMRMSAFASVASQLLT